MCLEAFIDHPFLASAQKAG